VKESQSFLFRIEFLNLTKAAQSRVSRRDRILASFNSR
jgi:hypothetical protein